MTIMHEEDAVTVTDIKQWGYCKRVVYYQRCLPDIRPTTYLMRHGRQQHEDQPRHAVRRVLPAQDVASGSREFAVRYFSAELGISGMVDEIIRADDGSIIPVDYKNASTVANNHKLQLTAYSLLIEAKEQVVVNVGYIYLIPKRKMVRIAITDTLKTTVRQILTGIFTMIDREWMPPLPENTNLCVGCEFRRFCNDIG